MTEFEVDQRTRGSRYFGLTDTEQMNRLQAYLDAKLEMPQEVQDELDDWELSLSSRFTDRTPQTALAYAQCVIAEIIVERDRVKSRTVKARAFYKRMEKWRRNSENHGG